MPVYLGIDTGGTFTDFILLDATGLRVHKVLSTPAAPEQAILQGIRALGLAEAEDLVVVHGSTVATNAVLEGKGVRTALVTNQGLRDLLTIGRQARAALYDLNPPPPLAPVPRALCLETGGRIGADGTMLEELTEAMLARLRKEIEALAPRAVAINLLFSYLDDRAERRIAAALPPHLFVSRSSEVLPEYREYERGIATWLNATVGPLMQGYLERLCHGIPRAALAVMQSAGGAIGADQAGAQAVHLLLSGPAGGLAGVRQAGLIAGCNRLLSFDMGGTSTDVALLDGEPQLTTEGRIGPYPVGVSMVDIHTIGAGGGSIARVDGGGLLQVGPQSAGAEPGPACYGRGGQEATVTDANLVLGRLRADSFLGGGLRLDEAAARAALGRVARSMRLSVEEAALGVISVANEHMARALRVMSVQRGVDPAALTLASFGGAGGLHVCALAEALGMRQALVPQHAGVLSALGMLAAPRARHLSLTVNRLLEEMDADWLAAQYERLAQQGQAALQREGVAPDEIERRPSVDLRYRGQAYSINVPWRGGGDSAEEFQRRHAARYGHRLEQPLELVTLRLRVQRPGLRVELRAAASMPDTQRVAQRVQLVGIDAPVPVYERDSLGVGAAVPGPALITEAVSTTYLAPRWQACVHATGSLLLQRD